MLLRLRRMMTPGSSYFVKLLLEDTIAVVEARVVRIEGGEVDDDCLAGLEFLSMSTTDASILRGFIHR
jgi:c-di-GMP-binding flagellar brake protein YcgR